MSWVLLKELAETSHAVSQTSSRKAKSDLLAGVIGQLGELEIEPAIGFLTGSARQGRIGVGWATVGSVEVTEATSPSVTVLDLDRLIDKLAATTGTGSEADRTAMLEAFFAKATAIEQEFVRHILIGDLRQGALSGVVTDAVAKAAKVKIAPVRRAAMLSGDLGHAAVVALTQGVDGLDAITLQAGRPILPMLASTAADVGEALENTGAASVEWKLDGARIQVHRTAAGVRIYTRNLNDVTGRLPGVVEIVEGFDCSSLVLDGEVMGFMHDDTPLAFQDTMSQLGQENESAAEPAQSTSRSTMRPFFFDIMELNGRSLIDEPLKDRRAVLDDLVGVHNVPAISTTDPHAAQSHLDDALARRHEGVMVKALDGRYEAGRRGKSWRKVKPVHTLDLVVLAAEWGHGRRQGWLSNLHLGARDPDTGEFVMVGKTFKGLTDEILTWQTEQFLERRTRESSTGHTVYITNDLVVEIAVDGVQTSTRYPGGVALRFARVRAYRPDKSADEADTIDAVRSLR